MIVRKLRLQRGWTQDQLSEISGLSIRTIQRLERGAKPSLETAKSLAAISGFLIYKEGPTEKLLLVLGALGIAMVIHGLFVFEILRFPTVNFERRLAEWKLGRKL